MNKSNNNIKPQVLTSLHSSLPHHIRPNQGISNIKITNVQLKTSSIKHKRHCKPISTNYNSNLNVFLTAPSVNQDEKIKLSSETNINPNIKTHSIKVTTSHSYNNIFTKNSINSTNYITPNQNDSSLLKSTTSPFKQPKIISNIFIKEEQKTELVSHSFNKPKLFTKIKACSIIKSLSKISKPVQKQTLITKIQPNKNHNVINSNINQCNINETTSKSTIECELIDTNTEEEMIIHKPLISCNKKLICDFNYTSQLPTYKELEMNRINNLDKREITLKVLRKNLELRSNKKQYEINQEQEIGSVQSQRSNTTTTNEDTNSIAKLYLRTSTPIKLYSNKNITRNGKSDNKKENKRYKLITSFKSDSYFLSMFSYPNIFVKSQTNKIKNKQYPFIIIYSFLTLGDLYRKCLFINKTIFKDTLKYIYTKLRKDIFNRNNHKGKYDKTIKSLLIKTPKKEKNKNIDEIYFDYYRSNSIYEADISKDITRTFPNDNNFKRNGSKYRPLSNLLHAYSLFKPKIGYAQGLNFLFGSSLFLYEDLPSAFFFIHGMIKRFKIKEIFALQNNKLPQKIKKLGLFLKKHIGELCEYLESNYVNHEFFTTNWVLTLFSNGMKRNLLFIVWDFMIVLGWDFFDYFAVELLLSFKTDIIECSITQISRYMRELVGMNEFEQRFPCIIERTLDKMLIDKCKKYK